MIMTTRMKITRGGQISIPAAIRRRWGSSTVVLDDRGDCIVLKPAPDDPIAAAAGALADEFGRVRGSDLRREARKSERSAEDRRAPRR
jgi:AbrB family looped-hinge helix DNA binding protein